VTDLVFKEIMPNARLLTLEVFGKQISFDLEAKDVEKFRKAYDEGAKNEREAKNAAAPLQLEEGQWYEDEEKELWQVKDKIEHTCTEMNYARTDFEAQNNRGKKRRFRPDGISLEWKAANLIRKIEPLSLEIGERYEDESGLFWDIMRSSKEIFVGINNQTIRDFNADGKYAPCNLMDYTHGKNLIRKIEPLSLERGQWYEDEGKELWQVKDKIEHTCQHPDGTKIDFQVIHYLAQNNKGLKRRFYSNGSCVEMKGANLVRKAPPVESEKRSRTFAETLREQAANFNSIEKRVARIKEMAAEAASNGLLKMEVDSYVLYDNMLQEELAKFGFFVYGEYHQNWHNPTPYLAKVWLDWSEKI